MTDTVSQAYSRLLIFNKHVGEPISGPAYLNNMWLWNSEELKQSPFRLYCKTQIWCRNIVREDNRTYHD